MKKLLLSLLVAFSVHTVNAQSDYDVALPSNGATTGVRGPQGGVRYQRSVWVITAAEMTAAGFITGNTLNSLGFNATTALDVPATGNIQIYLQNTADVSNLKSTTWATAISTMTSVSNGSVTLPNTLGDFNIPFTGAPFTYTGGGIYVAFDYQNPTSTLPAVASVLQANNSLTAGGTKSANSPTAAPATLGANSAFRPVTIFGRPVSCSRPTLVSATGITNTTANVNFTVSGGSTEIQYGVYNFVLGSGTTLTNVTSPTTISGLSPSNVYEYYVRKTCGGATGISAWSGPFSFNTPFLPATPTYTTSFEQENFPYLGWSLLAGTPLGSDWQIVNFGPPSVTNTLTQDGDVSVYSLSGVTTAAANNWIISRGINLTAGSTVTISFYTRNYQATASTGTASYNLTVGNAQTIVAQTTNIATEAPFAGQTWIQKSYTYSPTTTGTYYFGIQNISPANTTGVQALFIDNLVISQLLSSNDVVFNKFLIYPNPVKNSISISNSENINVKSVSISDLNGRVIKTENFSNVSDIKVNVSGLSSGMYLMNINSDQGVVTKKIVKE
jgi:Secretion system C-terminal sorting domain